MGIISGNEMWMGMKTRLNLGVRMGMGLNHWKWEEMGLKTSFQLSSSRHPISDR